MPTHNVITVENLHVAYGETVAVDDVSFSVKEGEIYGILGPNGAGKTTTVECVGALRRPDAGRIEVLGLDPQRRADELHQLVGIQLQQAELPEKLKVGEALSLFASFYRTPADPDRLLSLLGLTEQRGVRFGKLSGGQKQRLSIALALIGRPRVAILDELTTGLDPQARRDTWGLIEGIREEGVTVLLVTHFMEEAERLCDRVALIDRGRVVAIDTPAALAARAGAEQRIRFRPSRPVDLSLLHGLADVTAVIRHGQQLEVTGTGNLLGVVITALTRAGVVAEELRVEQANLEDAFVALTQHVDANHDRPLEVTR
ncbi:MAG TPA: ABC transporter ATP-binding protein [Solirubrobacteraceae bacterium]|nr:ABC transporter ATP-binding protein [Solirubrobacteraceae bacterium]